MERCFCVLQKPNISTHKNSQQFQKLLWEILDCHREHQSLKEQIKNQISQKIIYDFKQKLQQGNFTIRKILQEDSTQNPSDTKDTSMISEISYLQTENQFPKIYIRNQSTRQTKPITLYPNKQIRIDMNEILKIKYLPEFRCIEMHQNPSNQFGIFYEIKQAILGRGHCYKIGQALLIIQEKKLSSYSFCIKSFDNHDLLPLSETSSHTLYIGQRQLGVKVDGLEQKHLMINFSKGCHIISPYQGNLYKSFHTQ